MSKWIDIDDISLLKTVWVGGLSAKALWKRIRQQPSIDLVRCKDCKHRYVTGVTTQYYVCDFMDAEYRDDGYCHRGEREGNE